jgi:hypothetical protein
MEGLVQGAIKRRREKITKQLVWVGLIVTSIVMAPSCTGTHPVIPHAAGTLPRDTQGFVTHSLEGPEKCVPRKSAYHASYTRNTGICDPIEPFVARDVDGIPAGCVGEIILSDVNCATEVMFECVSKSEHRKTIGRLSSVWRDDASEGEAIYDVAVIDTLYSRLMCRSTYTVRLHAAE